MTSLALMSMAAVGNQPNDPTPEGRTMRRGLAYVLREDRQMADGYFGEADASRMYGHGITTLLLTELLGMGQDREQDALIRARAQKAVDLILRARAFQETRAFCRRLAHASDSPTRTCRSASGKLWPCIGAQRRVGRPLRSDRPGGRLRQAIVPRTAAPRRPARRPVTGDFATPTIPGPRSLGAPVRPQGCWRCRFAATTTIEKCSAPRIG